jgi:hypothetical protein
MKSPSPPATPNPNTVAQAQTGSNIGTAIAQGALNNMNQITPYGNLTTNQTGSYSFTDPQSGQTYQLPQYTQTQTLSPQQQKLLNSQTKGAISSSNIANQQLGKLGGILGQGVNTSGAQKVGMPDFATMGGTPGFQTMGGTPNLATSFANAGGIRQRVRDAGDITKTYGDPGGYGQQTKQVQDALMAKAMPGLNQDKASMTAALANQGIKQGTEAYDREMANHGTNVNDMRLDAILAGGQEQSRLAGLDQNKAQFQNAAQGQQYSQNANDAQFWNQGQMQNFGQLLARAGFGNQAKQDKFGDQMAARGFNNEARQQKFGNQLAARTFNNAGAQQTFGNQQGLRAAQLQEAYGGRNQSINEIATLLGLGQVQSPQFMSGPNNQVANTDTAGITMNGYQQKLNAWQQQQQQQQGMMGGLFGLGASGIMAMSDRRLKTDVSFLGMLRDLPIYAFRYIWGGPMQVGVMAQDMLSLRPSAVVVTPSGYLAVNYGAL